ncbi:MAG: type II toxin-antitoxin system RelE/ParE family toxin [Sulfuricellaceae bacterium]
MRVVLSDPARAELADARRYLDMQQPGLGNALAREVKQAAMLIAHFPMACQVERGEIRRCLLKRFPYKLLYAIRGRQAVVLAIAHQHRDPDYWIDRIPDA